MAIASIAIALICPLVTHADESAQPSIQNSTASAPAPARISAPNAPSEITVKLDPGSTLQVAAANSAGWSQKDWATFITSVLTSIVALAAMFLTWWTSRKAVVQRINEEEVASIQEKLDSFYGPYLQLSNTNRLIAEELHKGKSEDFRTLTALLDPNWKAILSKDDQILIGEIVRNDKSLDALIGKKAGLVDPQVQEYLWQASAHFRIIQLAHAGFLQPSKDTQARFKPYVYPRTLDSVLNEEVRRLSARCSDLRSNPTKRASALKPLTIPAELKLGQ